MWKAGGVWGGEKTRKNKTPKNKECTIANDVSISTSNEELCDMHGAHGLRTQLRSWHTGRESRQQAAWQTAWTTTSSGTRASLLLPARTSRGEACVTACLTASCSEKRGEAPGFDSSAASLLAPFCKKSGNLEARGSQLLGRQCLLVLLNSVILVD